MALQVTWGFYQELISAYGHPDNKSRGKKLMGRVITTLHKGLPAGLEELAQLGWTLWRRCADILAYCDLGASNGPVEARLNGRLEHLRGIALGFFESRPLHLEIPDSLRPAAGPDQRTLNREELVKRIPPRGSHLTPFLPPNARSDDSA